MLETGQVNWDSVEMVSIDMLVPKNYLFSKIDTAINFIKIYNLSTLNG